MDGFHKWSFSSQFFFLTTFLAILIVLGIECVFVNFYIPFLDPIGLLLFIIIARLCKFVEWLAALIDRFGKFNVWSPGAKLRTDVSI